MIPLGGLPTHCWWRSCCCLLMISRKFPGAKNKYLCQYLHLPAIRGSAIMQTQNYYLWDCSDLRYAGNLRTKSTQYINICNNRQYFPKAKLFLRRRNIPQWSFDIRKGSKDIETFYTWYACLTENRAIWNKNISMRTKRKF